MKMRDWINGKAAITAVSELTKSARGNFTAMLTTTSVLDDGRTVEDGKVNITFAPVTRRKDGSGPTMAEEALANLTVLLGEPITIDTFKGNETMQRLVGLEDVPIQQEMRMVHQGVDLVPEYGDLSLNISTSVVVDNDEAIAGIAAMLG